MNTTDPRITILDKLSTEQLMALRTETVTPLPLGMSTLFFAIGMSQEFRKTQPSDLVDLITRVLVMRGHPVRNP